MAESDLELRATLQEYLKRRIESRQGRIEMFMSEVKEHPAEALFNSQSVFDAAAELEVYQRTLSQIERGVELVEIRKSNLITAMTNARYPHRSTSETANLMEQSRLSAIVEIIEFISN